MKIGLDIAGGDYAPEQTTLGAIQAHNEVKGQDIQFVLIGNENKILEILKEQKVDPGEFQIVHTDEVIGMHDHPTKAFSQKPRSSIALGLGLLKKGIIDGFAGAGNTGAMMVGSVYTVKNIEGILRPCITSYLPKPDGGYNIILDVGVNADCKPEALYQFAILGSLYMQNLQKIESPKIGLLNIGEEEEKGNMLTQAAYALMKDSKDFNFIGNIEGRDIFGDKADVIVCDGYTGNIVLKEAEGLYNLIRERNLEDDYFSRFNYENYGGTPILGINANVVIGHGISNAKTIKNMLLLTAELAKAKLSEKIKKALNNGKN